MKLFSYLSLMGLAGIANCFDADTSYTKSVDGATKYITLAPKSTHSKTMLYLHGGGSSAAGAYGYLKTQQIATLETKVIILNAPISTGSGYVWYDTLPKGSGTTDSLGNDITGVQTGSNSLDAITTTILALIDTEKAALPSGKQSYANISVVGFSQGAATTVATLVKYNKSGPLGFMIAFAGWQPINKTNWASGSVAVQATIPFLQLAGTVDTNFCPLSWASFNTNLQPNIFTGGNASNIKWKTIAGVGHSVTTSVSAEMLAVSTNISALTGITNSANNCDTSGSTTKSTKDESNCTWTETNGKWACVANGSTYIQASALASVATAAYTLY